MISILDIGIGNINSVYKALNFLDIRYEVITNSNQLEKQKIIFPGVGSFINAITKLEK